MNKKGNVGTDLIVFLSVIFIFGVSMVMLYYVANVIQNTFTDVAPSLNRDGVNATQIAENTVGYLPTAFDSLKWISYMLIIGLGISIILGNFLVRTHPLFVIPYIFVVIIAVIIAVPLSNTYEELYYNEDYGEYFQGFIGLSYIFQYLPIWVLVFGILGGITMFVGFPRSKEYGEIV